MIFRQKCYEPSFGRRRLFSKTPSCKYLLIILRYYLSIAFFFKLQQCMPKVWLLSYDLYHRNFKKRETKLAVLAKTLFKDSGLQEAEDALWSNRIKLAAAVARLRIKNSALKLYDLLPKHLRTGGMVKRSPQSPVTCWVNTAKVK